MPDYNLYNPLPGYVSLLDWNDKRFVGDTNKYLSLSNLRETARKSRCTKRVSLSQQVLSNHRNLFYQFLISIRLINDSGSEVADMLWVCRLVSAHKPDAAYNKKRRRLFTAARFGTGENGVLRPKGVDWLKFLIEMPQSISEESSSADLSHKSPVRPYYFRSTQRRPRFEESEFGNVRTLSEPWEKTFG